VQPLINELISQGFSVQLKHVPKETSWDNVTEHGYVTFYSADGTKLAHRDGFQHNRKLRAGGSWDAKAVEEFVAEATKKLPVAKAA